MEAVVGKILECPITETVVFGELWKRRFKAQMISLEEGVLEHWFFGRIILAGDAIHKVGLIFHLAHQHMHPRRKKSSYHFRSRQILR